LRPAYWGTRRLLWRGRVRLYDGTGRLALMRKRETGAVRILTYHGVCRDGDEHKPWIPHYFVTESLLDRHLTWLRQVGDIVSLSEAHDILTKPGGSSATAYVVTFDDGFYNNLNLAAPILKARNVPATVFLATGPIDAGGDVPTWIKARFLKHLRAQKVGFLQDDAHARVITRGMRMELATPREVEADIEPLWQASLDLIEESAIDSTRLVSVEEVGLLACEGMDLGAHTVSHPRLARVDAPDRRDELVRSVSRVRELTGIDAVPFAYPNGKPQDFGDSDIDILRELGVPLAVTTTPGANRPGVDLDPYRLFRLPVSGRRSRADFLAMVSGMYDWDRSVQPP